MSTDDDRRCTRCGKSVEDLPYELWLFSTCRSCAAEPAPPRYEHFGTPSFTYRKWRYFPRWHMIEKSDTVFPNMGVA